MLKGDIHTRTRVSSNQCLSLQTEQLLLIAGNQKTIAQIDLAQENLSCSRSSSVCAPDQIIKQLAILLRYLENASAIFTQTSVASQRL